MIADQRERRNRPYEHLYYADWHRTLHLLAGLVWPCERDLEFADAWAAVTDEMATRGLSLGRASFGAWDDGDASLAQAAYCLTRTLNPETVIETGVGHGITTRLILEALDRNGRLGRLWSVDLPPLLARGLAVEVAAAVPAELRARWTLRPGSSRRVLSGLLDQLGGVGLFVHDSIHTGRNVSFELARVWEALTPGGAAIVDDVDYNQAFTAFVAQTPEARALIGEHDDQGGMFGILLKDT